jgi:homoserine dehydrogenase
MATRCLAENKRRTTVNKSKINVGLIGWGTVGTGVSKVLINSFNLIRQRTGIDLELRKIADRNVPTTREGVAIEPSRLTKYPDEVINDPNIDIVVEMIGGIDYAKDYILRAIANGKHIVTANKTLLARYGREIFKAAHENNVSLLFEGSVAGGIPIIKALREGFAANQIQAIYGIINGTTNYILTQMSDNGTDYNQALSEAQAKGYAEKKDPTADVEGHDAAQKITLLTSLAYGFDMPLENIYTEGITKITQKDIQYAKELGYVIKLLAISKFSEGKVEVRVHPTMLPERSMFANVSGVFNAIYVVGDPVGNTMFYGQGAGQQATSSAVVADIIDIAKGIKSNSPIPVPPCWHPDNTVNIPLRPISECQTRYYMRLIVVDRPGVLAQIAGILGQHQISIASVIQKEQHGPNTVYLVMLIHKAVEEKMQNAIRHIDELEVVKDNSMLIRVENEL